MLKKTPMRPPNPNNGSASQRLMPYLGRAGKRARTEYLKSVPLTTIFTPSMDANDSAIKCGICLEAFGSEKRAPKLLPCGHNFCEECIFSLCLHREYYLLDSIRCPKCRRSCAARVAMSAPTNYDLCDSRKPHVDNKTPIDNDTTFRSNAQTTVIEVPLKNSAIQTNSTPIRPHQQSLKRNSGRCRRHGAEIVTKTRSNIISKRQKSVVYNKCCHCERRLPRKNFKALNAACRFCADCNQTKAKEQTTNILDQICCLECCVNWHNGHNLQILAEFELANRRRADEFYRLHRRCIEMSNVFDAKCDKNFFSNTNSQTLNAIINAKQLLMDEIERFYESIIQESQENYFLNQISLEKQARLWNYLTQLQKMCSWIQNSENEYESSAENIYEVVGEDLENLQFSPTINWIKAELRLSISTLLAALKSVCLSTKATAKCSIPSPKSTCEYLEVVEKTLYILKCDEQSNKTLETNANEERFEILCSCVKALNSLMNENLNTEILPLFENAFVNVFKALNLLSKRHSPIRKIQLKKKDSTLKGKRKQVWKLVQGAFGELLRIASLQWTSADINRIDFIADMSTLCVLFADVADPATIIVCIIEAARARAARNAEDKHEQHVAAQLKVC